MEGADSREGLEIGLRDQICSSLLNQTGFYPCAIKVKHPFDLLLNIDNLTFVVSFIHRSVTRAPRDLQARGLLAQW